MKYFEMGEKVIVSGTMYPFYEEGKRRWLRRPIRAKEAFYVGYTYKQEGTLTKKSPYVNSSLKDIKSIKLLRVKFSDWGNDKFVLLQDVRRMK